MKQKTFSEWFKDATGYDPFPFQREFAEGRVLPQLVRIPTGLGKTEMAVLGWLWRRRFAGQKVRTATPRRLVYCLPMRVLVEQTRDKAVLWLKKLNLLAGSAEFEDTQKLRCYSADFQTGDKITVLILMGGETEEEWDIYPERDQILIGTQDMLLSRALNRGYAASRSRWPMQFGLLNTDCLWVFDEIQLMGAGLGTTTQLEGFRRLLVDKDAETAAQSNGCLSVWMSATLSRDWLRTVDFKQFVGNMRELGFNFQDQINSSQLSASARQTLTNRWQAKKPLHKAKATMGDSKALADQVLKTHECRPGTRTLVIVNTVDRARLVFKELSAAVDKASSKPQMVLLHSRFRPEDRKGQVDRALAPPKGSGTIVVSTQVIEAGVDVSAATLFTEVSPWASLVQRFGRCNRRGEDDHQAQVYWISLPANDTQAEKIAAPYELQELKAAQEQLSRLTDVGLACLPDLPLAFEHTHIIRRKDIVDLFDTTPDLAGNDIDIDRFIRDVEDSDVQVFWRDYKDTPRETQQKEAEPAPRPEELCPVLVGDFKKFITDKDRMGLVWRWDFLSRNWNQVTQENQVVPGEVYLVHVTAGGYSSERGWDPSLKHRVRQIGPAQGAALETPDATEADPLSQIEGWQTIAEHSDDLCRVVDEITQGLDLTSNEQEALRQAARWHDRGKAHRVFQAALPQQVPRQGQLWAKTPKQGWKRYERPCFRHELASALAVLDPQNTLIPDNLRDLVAYLVAAHHGKVRLSIRSLPNELRPDESRRFARGIWDGDELPETDLGNGIVAPEVTLSLEPMELGLCQESPFTGQPSWAERVITLRDRLGPFRLAYLEAILRAADMRASRMVGRKAAQ